MAQTHNIKCSNKTQYMREMSAQITQPFLTIVINCFEIIDFLLQATKFSNINVFDKGIMFSIFR